MKKLLFISVLLLSKVYSFDYDIEMNGCCQLAADATRNNTKNDYISEMKQYYDTWRTSVGNEQACLEDVEDVIKYIQYMIVNRKNTPAYRGNFRLIMWNKATRRGGKKHEEYAKNIIDMACVSYYDKQYFAFVVALDPKVWRDDEQSQKMMEMLQSYVSLKVNEKDSTVNIEWNED